MAGGDNAVFRPFYVQGKWVGLAVQCQASGDGIAA